MQSKTIIDLLSNENTKNFIGLHINDDVKALALKAKKYPELNIKVICGLISLYQKASEKLPAHYASLAALNPKSYEQCTSEAVAKFKADLMGLNDKTVINVTGGLGIDDWAMSKKAKKIYSCEIDQEVHQLAEYNAEILKLKNINRLLADGIHFVKSSTNADLIYMDPDRRVGAKKSFRLDDCEPDVVKNMPLLMAKAPEVWIKVSPLADISYLLTAVPEIHKIYVIALQGEVKELLLQCKAMPTEVPERIAINIEKEQTYIFNSHEKSNQMEYRNQGDYLLAPGNAVIKAGLSQEYANLHKVHMMAPKSHLYVSDHIPNHFDGRIMKIINHLIYKPKEVERYLRSQEIGKCLITVRNHRESVENLRSRFKLKEGGPDVLFFTSDTNQVSRIFHCRSIL